MSEALDLHPENRDTSHRKAVERVIHAMHDGLGEDMSLEDMSRQAFISPFHFNRIFRRVVGIPPIHFLSALRIQAAKRMLVATEQRVIDICLEVGFTSPGTFSRRFKELVGLGPLQFRRLAARKVETAQIAELPAGISAERVLQGWITAPEGFSGLIFLGLFQSALPHRRPLSCCVLRRPGVFHLAEVPDGKYYLLALGFPDGVPMGELLLGDGALRAGSTSQPIAFRDGRPAAELRLDLRSAEITDPPILVTIPWLMLNALRVSSSRAFSTAMFAFTALSFA